MSSDYLSGLFGLDGQVIVVIGGTGALGGALCEGIAQAGAHVIVAGRNVERGQQRAQAIAQLGAKASFHSADVTSRSSIESLLHDTVEEFGRVDGLINGAGVNSAVPYFEIQDDDWDQVLASNLSSTHFGCQVFAKHMVESGAGGSIINIGSVTSGLPLSRVYAYSASKAAVLSLTRNLARELAPHSVRVNALCPGFFPAEQNRRILDDKRVADIMRHTPMNRFGEPSELIGTALLLLSPVAGSFITGAAYFVDGGFTAMTI